jgi:hypothetical protein
VAISVSRRTLIHGVNESVITDIQTQRLPKLVGRGLFITTIEISAKAKVVTMLNQVPPKNYVWTVAV